MLKKDVKFNTKKNGIEFKIVRPKKDTHVFACPMNPEYFPSGLHISYGEKNNKIHYDLFNEDRSKTGEQIELYGFDSTPSVYLHKGENWLKVHIPTGAVEVLPLTETSAIDDYIGEDGYCVSSSASCWVILAYDVDKVGEEELEKAIEDKQYLDLF